MPVRRHLPDPLQVLDRPEVRTAELVHGGDTLRRRPSAGDPRRRPALASVNKAVQLPRHRWWASWVSSPSAR